MSLIGMWWVSETPSPVTRLGSRAPLYHPDFPAIILWSEKSACTVIAKWFFQHVGLLETALGYHRWVHNYENEVFKAREDYLNDCIRAINAGKPIVKFVRNPYVRAYSGYLETCRRRVLETSDHWSRIARQQILDFVIGSVGELEYAYSFNQFAQWLGQQPIDSLDPHLAPQWQPPEAELDIQVIQLEDEPNPFLDFEKAHGLPSTEHESLVHSSGHHHVKRDVTIEQAVACLDVGLPVQRRVDFKVFDVGPGAIARTTAGQILRRVYEHDFESYGYDKLLVATPTT